MLSELKRTIEMTWLHIFILQLEKPKARGEKRVSINHMAGTVTTNACLEPKSQSCSRCTFECFETEINSWLHGCLNKGKVPFSFLC